MARPRKKQTVPVPDKYAVRPGDLLVLRRNSSRSPRDFVFGEACQEGHQFYEDTVRRHLVTVRRNLEDYRLLAVWRDGVLVAKVLEPPQDRSEAMIRVPTHPRLALRGQTG